MLIKNILKIYEVAQNIFHSKFTWVALNLLYESIVNISWKFLLCLRFFYIIQLSWVNIVNAGAICNYD